MLVLDQLSQTAFWLNRLATWLAERDAITESDKCEEAAEKLCTAAWLLERPIRPQRLAGQWQPASGGYVLRDGQQPGMEPSVLPQQGADQQR